MHRRDVLKAGTAGMAVGAIPGIWAWSTRGDDFACDAAIRLLSRQRRAAKLAALELDPALTEMARRHAVHMAELGAVSHFGPDGQEPPLRARLAGFPGHVLGETLAETHDGPLETMAFWLAHRPTRDVLMDPAARHVGIAAVMGRSSQVWWNLVAAT